MFTGIIEELGTVKDLKKGIGVFHLTISAKTICKDTREGDSICVNGACLTVKKLEKEKITFDIMQETIDKTNLGGLKTGDRVNLERALKANARFGGHFVTGHIDGTGIIKEKIIKGQNVNPVRKGFSNGVNMIISVSEDILKYLIPKGCVAVDGVSLTIVGLDRKSFSISLIPYTLKTTTLGFKRYTDVVNIEVDMFAKYVYKYIIEKEPKITKEFLREYGFK